MFPLTSPSNPKHLLPVGGIPLIVRTLTALKASGFSQCVICVAHDDKSTFNLLKKESELTGAQVYTFQKTLQVTLHQLSETCAGSAEALKDVEEASIISPTSHLVVMPGDLVIMEPTVLKHLAHSHRQGNLLPLKAACTMILVDVGEQDENGVPLKESSKAKKGGLAREEEDIEYIALSVSRKNTTLPPRVVWKQSKIDVEEDEDMVGSAPQFVIPKPRLRAGEITRVRRDWSDVHVYAIAPWVRKLWNARPSLISVQSDLIPLLVTRQFKGIEATFGSQEQAKKVYQEAVEEEHSVLKGDKEYAIRAEVLDGSKVLRASTVPAYLIAGREIVVKAVQDEKKENPCLSIPPETAVNAKLNSIVLNSAELGEKCQVKSSTVGRGVKLGFKARLNNTLIMDNATVGDNTILQNSIIGEGCTIGENCNLNDCQVPNGKVIPAGTKEKGESFVDDIS